APAEGLGDDERPAQIHYTGISRLLLGHAYFILGDHARALTHFAAALSVSEQVRIFRPGALIRTAETQARLGHLDEAVELLGLSEQVIEQIGSAEGLAWFPSGASPTACMASSPCSGVSGRQPRNIPCTASMSSPATAIDPISREPTRRSADSSVMKVA